MNSGKNSIGLNLKIGGVDPTTLLNKILKSPCFLPVLLQILRHDEVGQSTNFLMRKIVTYLIFYVKFTCPTCTKFVWGLSGPRVVTRVISYGR